MLKFSATLLALLVFACLLVGAQSPAKPDPCIGYKALVTTERVRGQSEMLLRIETEHQNAALRQQLSDAGVQFGVEKNRSDILAGTLGVALKKNGELSDALGASETVVRNQDYLISQLTAQRDIALRGWKKARSWKASVKRTFGVK